MTCPREKLAKVIYERGMLYLRPELPDWVEGGNSLAQCEARAAAHSFFDDLVLPLKWYDRPKGQKQRIGRCGSISYSVSFDFGQWGYRENNKPGHIVSRPGGVMFVDESDAIEGANESHRAAIMSALGLDN